MSEGKTGLRRHLSFANVASCMALVVALTMGSAYASSHLIGTDDIENRAVTTPKLADDAVAAKKLRANAVRERHIRDGSVNSAKVEDGSLTGDDIDQSTLDDVDAALLGGNAPGDFGAGLVTGRIDGLHHVEAFGSPSGTSQAHEDEDARSTLSPAAPVVARDLQVEMVEPIVVTRTFSLVVDDAATDLSCTIAGSPGGIEPPVEGQRCSSSEAVAVAPGSRLSIRHEVGPFGSPGPSPPGGESALFGWRATMP